MMAKKKSSGDVVIDVTGGVKKKKVSKAVKAVANQKLPMRDQDPSLVQESNVTDFAKDRLFTYGSYVVEDRAVADYRDGLKPVHRAVLWSMVGLGLRPSSGYKKSARSVGEALGKYHPHGDAACYGAMVTIANTVPPIVDGQGNWGTPVSSHAAMRYTEARISKFAHTFLVDPMYLKVVEKIPNFSDDFEIPLYMPALLPYLLFNGQVPAPAYGVRAGNPTFSVSSVSKIVIDMLNGKEYSAKKLAKTLKIIHPYGCEAINELDVEHIQTGKGKVEYGALLDAEVKTRIINVISFVPGTLDTADRIDKFMAKISAYPEVRSVYNKQGKKTKGSGPYGAKIVIECKKNIEEDQFHDLVDKVDKAVSGSTSYRLGVTVRRKDKPNAFKYLGYKSFLDNWIKYRVRLETRLIDYLMAAAERDLFVNETYLLAVERLKELLKALPKVLASKDPDKALAKAMKITLEQAKIILDRQVRQLSKMEASVLKDKIKAIKADIKQLKQDAKEPGKRAARDTKERVSKYMKNPDNIKSGVTVQ
jgi:DNA gyrase/topoisomerase IV subunit A